MLIIYLLWNNINTIYIYFCGVNECKLLCEFYNRIQMKLPAKSKRDAGV